MTSLCQFFLQSFVHQDPNINIVLLHYVISVSKNYTAQIWSSHPAFLLPPPGQSSIPIFFRVRMFFTPINVSIFSSPSCPPSTPEHSARCISSRRTPTPYCGCTDPGTREWRCATRQTSTSGASTTPSPGVIWRWWSRLPFFLNSESPAFFFALDNILRNGKSVMLQSYRNRRKVLE